MKDYIILIDSSCDLPFTMVEKLKTHYLGLVCNFKGKEFIDDCGQSLSYIEFYDELKKGEQPFTGQINVFRFEEEFKKHVKDNKSILYIAFSSALSGTYNSSLVAREQILEEFEDADISIVDSRAASMGVGLLVYYACELKKQGKSKEEVLKWIENNKNNVCHFFTVDDLHHLKRGGRISATAATFGSILNIKPILSVDEEGKLIPVTKVKGNKKAIKTLFDYFEKNVINHEDQTVFISHSDNLEGAKLLEKMIRDKYTVKDIIINYIGLAIGSHTGVGTVALFFLGDKKQH